MCSKARKSVIQCTRCLFKSINRLLKKTNMIKLLWVTKARGRCIWIVSRRSPWRKSFFTSSWRTGRWWVTTIHKIFRMVAILTTRLKFSSKSILERWLLPFSTNRSLYLFREPFAFYFFLNNHMDLTMFTPNGCGTRIHVLLLTEALYYSCMALIQFGSSNACR